MSTHPLANQPQLKAVLDRLHAVSLQQERDLNAKHNHFPKDAADKVVFEDQLVALDEDKCIAMYLLLRSLGPLGRRVVEAGTSYGVSLMWLLAAVQANDQKWASSKYVGLPPLVIGTENEPKKAAKARAHVQEAFGQTPPFLKFLEGDILKTLVEANLENESIDLLLLDIWTPLALGTTKIMQEKLRTGGIILADNVTASKDRYRELLEYLDDEKNGFKGVTLPFSGGLGMWVRL